jgi:hypothetical protein
MVIKKSRFFLLFLLDDRKIRIRKAQKHADPHPAPDPDPQQWLKYIPITRLQLQSAD